MSSASVACRSLTTTALPSLAMAASSGLRRVEAGGPLSYAAVRPVPDLAPALEEGLCAHAPTRRRGRVGRRRRRPARRPGRAPDGPPSAPGPRPSRSLVAGAGRGMGRCGAGRARHGHPGRWPRARRHGWPAVRAPRRPPRRDAAARGPAAGRSGARPPATAPAPRRHAAACPGGQQHGSRVGRRRRPCDSASQVIGSVAGGRPGPPGGAALGLGAEAEVAPVSAPASWRRLPRRVAGRRCC